MTVNLKKLIPVVLGALIFFCMLTPLEASFAGVKTYKQKGYALAKYSVNNYKPVNNLKLKPLTIKKNEFHTYCHIGNYNDVNPDGIDYPHILGTSKGNKDIKLMTMFHLPKRVSDLNLDLGNPQSLSVTPDGNTAYVTHAISGTKGIIIKYDLMRMRRMGLDIQGEMGEFRKALHWSTARYDEEYIEQLMSCMKIGPKFEMGHGGAFSYNPKDGCLWFSSKTGQNKTNIQRINMQTLKPDLCINYTMASNKNISFGNHMTFDKNGKLYFFAYAHSKQGKCPNNAIKIYQGTINLKAKKKITFKLMMNVIRNPIAGNYGVQSAGYDPVNNRIFMVSNSAILSVPVNKLVKTKLKPADVWETQFDQKREFEGFECDRYGRYYLLTNKYPEIMTNYEPWQGMEHMIYDKFGEFVRWDFDDDDNDDDDDDDDDDDWVDDEDDDDWVDDWDDDWVDDDDYEEA